MAKAIHVGGVEEGNAAIERLVNDRYALVVVAGAVNAGKRHAAKPDGRHFDTG